MLVATCVLDWQRDVACVPVRQRFSKYGARDVTVAQSGPINSVKSVLFKTLRRDNPHRHVKLMVEDRQLVITSCDHENKQCAPLWKGTP